MPGWLRNTLALVAGLVVGGVVNTIVIGVSPALVPLPAGVDPSNAESLAGGIHLFQPRHFVMPFLAHALGTFAGALVAFLLAASYKQRFALAVGGVFLCGGIAASFMIPAPAWFIALDLLLAYIPMAWLAARLGSHVQGPAR